MEEKFLEFKALWENRETRAEARALAEELVRTYSGYFARFAEVAHDEMIDLVTIFRNAGKEIARLGADIYLLASFEQQHIGGEGAVLYEPPARKVIS